MTTFPTRRLLSVVMASCLALLLLGASSASAAGPRIVAPKRGAVLALGSQPTFKVRDGSRNARKYKIFMRISTSKARSKYGDLKQARVGGQTIGTFTSMKRRRTTHSYKAEKYSFPTWYMNRPGKYYWQAFRIDCRVRGCHIHSKVSSFIVR
ncbi:MAG: hypothetical protein ACR2J6_08515 [Thermoleophilaceae bacterium]